MNPTKQTKTDSNLPFATNFKDLKYLDKKVSYYRSSQIEGNIRYKILF